MRGSILFSCLLAILMIGAPKALGQASRRPTALAAEIHGQVRYQLEGKPAENVLVRLDSFVGSVTEVLTDHTGKFSFRNLGRDQYTVIAHAQGYIDAQRDVNLVDNTTDYVLLNLKPDKSALGTAKAGTGKASTVSANANPEASKEYDSGRSEFDNKNPSEAIAHLEKAITLSPNFFAAQLLLGTAYMDSHQLQKAEGPLKRAQQLNPNAAGPLLALGELYCQQKKYPEAEKALLDGLKLDDNSAEGHLALGRVYWEQKDIAKAGIQVGTALELKPDYADAHLLAGNIFLRARQPENARINYEEYLRLEPSGAFAEQTRKAVAKIKDALAQNQKKN